MFKFILIGVCCLLFVGRAKCAAPDTIISYFKYYPGGLRNVETAEEADFVRMILPPDPGDKLTNIREYYKDGKIKFIGKGNPLFRSQSVQMTLVLAGECISYYPNGKKQSIIHYTNGGKDGAEYLFYPNGAIYCYIKNSKDHDLFIKSINWECYDTSGAMICKEGNGQWLMYDAALKNILFSGPVKNGLKEGDWHGRIPDADSITYMAKFSKGHFVSGIGYDKAGTAYPFKNDKELISYRGGPITFIQIFNSHLKLPRDQDGKKESAENLHISFIVEKDGHASHFETLEEVSPELKIALLEAMSKCRDWNPGRFYGIPYRARIILPLSFLHGYSKNSYDQEVLFHEQILGF